MELASGLTSQIVTRCRMLSQDLTDADTLARLSRIRRSLDEPLQIAVIGRMERGKTTLVNTMVGRRVLATGVPTGCVTHLCGGFPERIRFQTQDGATHTLVADREDMALQQRLRDLSAARPGPLRLRVELAQQALADRSYLDTPPLDTPPLDAAGTSDRLDDAQAYLLVLSPQDLDAVTPGNTPAPAIFSGGRRDSAGTLSAATCVAVLGHADTIGSDPAAWSPLDPLQAARELLQRWVETLGGRATDAVVLATIWAQAARCGLLGEPELTALRHLASARGRTELTGSARHFLHTPSNVPQQHRAQLLACLGIDGVRVALALVDLGCDDAPSLCRELERVAGFDDLRRKLSDLVARRDLLQASWALSRLGSHPRNRPDAEAVHDAVEELRLDPTLHRLEGLTALHLLAQGIPASADLAREVRRLALADTPAQRLGLPHDTATEEMIAVAAQGAARWQASALGRPRVHQEQERFCRVMTRLYTHLRRQLMGSYL
jgi:hypothetical protein